MKLLKKRTTFFSSFRASGEAMAEAILKMLANAGKALNNPFSAGEYVKPTRGDVARDTRTVLGDMKKVGADLKKVTKRELASHGK
jgi:hypothetical protein